MWHAVRRASGALAMALAVAACGDLPKPFDHAQQGTPVDHDLLSLPDGRGIMVMPIEDAPDKISDRLVTAMVAALARANVPASARDSNRSSYFLESRVVWTTVKPDRTRIVLLWQLRDHDGRIVGRHLQHEETSAREWDTAAPILFAAIAANATPPIARFVQDEDQEMAALASDLKVAIGPVEGAPGDGNATLARAVAFLLEHAGMTVVSDIGWADAIVLGTVDLGPPRDGTQSMAVDWSVIDPDGEEIGSINQANNIPAGALDGPWGDIAFAIATGATEGIVALLDRIAATQQ